MTVSVNPRRAGPFQGNNVATVFPFLFTVFVDADVQVFLLDSAGIAVPLVRGTHYSVSRNGDQFNNPGGSVTYPLSGPALAPGAFLVVLGGVPYLQGTALPPGGKYRATVVERALDFLAVQVQQLVELSLRTLKAPPGSAANMTLPTDPRNSLNRGRQLVVDADGNIGLGATQGNAATSGGNAFLGAQTVNFSDLTDGPTVPLDLALSNHFLLTLGGNRALGAPTGFRDGGIYNFWLRQDTVGGRTLAFPASFKWPGGSTPSLSSAPNAVDLVIAQWNAALGIFACNMLKDVR